jgi:hypothetical protein
MTPRQPHSRSDRSAGRWRLGLVHAGRGLRMGMQRRDLSDSQCLRIQGCRCLPREAGPSRPPGATSRSSTTGRAVGACGDGGAHEELPRRAGARVRRPRGRRARTHLICEQGRKVRRTAPRSSARAAHAGRQGGATTACDPVVLAGCRGGPPRCRPSKHPAETWSGRAARSSPANRPTGPTSPAPTGLTRAGVNPNLRSP